MLRCRAITFPGRPLVTLPVAEQRPMTPALPVSAASALGPNPASGVPTRYVRPAGRPPSASHGDERHRAFCHCEDERPSHIYAFRGDAVLTFDPRFFISVAAFLLPRRRYPLWSQLLGNSPWGWNSDDHRCCKNCAGCSLAGLWQRTDHCGNFRNGIHYVPAQPVSNAAKIVRRMSAMLPHIRFAGRASCA